MLLQIQQHSATSITSKSRRFSVGTIKIFYIFTIAVRRNGIPHGKAGEGGREGAREKAIKEANRQSREQIIKHKHTLGMLILLCEGREIVI